MNFFFGGEKVGEMSFGENDSKFFFPSEMETSSTPRQQIGGLEAPSN